MEQSLKNLKPMTAEKSRECWEVPNEEFDALEHHCATHPYQVSETDSIGPHSASATCSTLFQRTS